MINGLIIWGDSFCRSTLAFYRELGIAFGVPLKVFIFTPTCYSRIALGFSKDEFQNMDISYVNDLANPYEVINKYSSWNHLFGVYQKNNGCRKIIEYAINMKVRLAIVSEAPCNMDKLPRRALKSLYIKCILPIMVKNVVNGADFILSLSGYDNEKLKSIGWPSHKIIPCGYYSPPILGSNLCLRDEKNWNNFTILLSGQHQWHRSPLILLKALSILDQKGLKYNCIITQTGPLLKSMHKYAKRHKMTNVQFVGFLPIEKLISLYETCSVYVGTGSYEPWGMRINDVLNCGSPIVVSTGMGSNMLIKEYGCGLSFNRGDYKELAKALEKMITSKDLFLEKSNIAYNSANMISPKMKAGEIVKKIQNQYKGWS